MKWTEPASERRVLTFRARLLGQLLLVLFVVAFWLFMLTWAAILSR